MLARPGTLPNRLLWVGFLFLLTGIALAIYWTVLPTFFALDDYIWLQSASNPELGSYLYGAFSFPEGSLFDAPTPFWRPLIDVYFYVAWRVFGDDPLPYHLVNLSLHVVVAAGTGLVAYQLSRSRVVGAAGSLVFIALPSYDFAVTWISSITEVLGAALFVLALTSFLGFRRAKDGRLYTVALALFVLGLLSKESTVILPAILALVAVASDPTASRASAARLARQLLPFGLLAAVYFTFLFFQEYRSSSDAGLYRFGWHAFENIWNYLEALTFPVAPDRGQWVDEIRPFSASAFLVVSAILAVRRDMAGCALVTWVFLALLPYSFFPAGIEARYLYLASVPFSIFLVYIVWLIFRECAGHVRTAASAAGVFVLIAVVALSAIETRHRQTWISLQADAYEELYTGVPAACGTVPPGASIYILEPRHFDLFGVSTNMALNLVYEDVFVSLQPDGKLPELAAFVEDKCVVRHTGERYAAVE